VLIVHGQLLRRCEGPVTTVSVGWSFGPICFESALHGMGRFSVRFIGVRNIPACITPIRFLEIRRQCPEGGNLITAGTEKPPTLVGTLSSHWLKFVWHGHGVRVGRNVMRLEVLQPSGILRRVVTVLTASSKQ
jgi:hypothetical protein